jgi:hypothetical protein
MCMSITEVNESSLSCRDAHCVIQCLESWEWSCLYVYVYYRGKLTLSVLSRGALRDPVFGELRVVVSAVISSLWRHIHTGWLHTSKKTRWVLLYFTTTNWTYIFQWYYLEYLSVLLLAKGCDSLYVFVWVHACVCACMCWCARVGLCASEYELVQN